MIFSILYFSVFFCSLVMGTLGEKNNIYYFVSFFLYLFMLLLVFVFARDNWFYIFFSISVILINMGSVGWRFFVARNKRAKNI